ncbi:MAG: hypothetical protein LBM66_04545 [Bifidobacteriaceae bacterium]|jgi:secretion/DNA translocation related TadE-like protein|nr:hypothetical protein [Bifidobacteriaceae bacterium]
MFRARAVRERAHRERGSGTVLMVGLVAALMVVALATALLAAALAAAGRARAAADLGALAGAQALIDGLGPAAACAAAAGVAAENGATLTDCSPGREGRLAVRVQAPAPLGRLGARTACAGAEAGPP